MATTSKEINLVLVNLWLFPTNTPHFGLISLAAFVRNKLPNVNLRIVEGMDPWEEIISNKPNIIGFTSDTMAFTKTVKLAKELKKKIKSFFIIGGVHITAMPESLDDIFDIGVIGEGEVTLVELLKTFLECGPFTKQNLANIEGIIFKDEDRIVYSGRRRLIENIDDLPYPAIDLTPMEEVYLNNQLNIFGVKRTASIMTSRGCPYYCIFCGSPVQWGKFRFHTPSYVVGEIKFLLDRYRIDGIMFWDDLFIAPKNRLIELVDLIKKEGLHKRLTFFGYARANLIDEETCKLLKDIKVRRLNFGLESGSEAILRYLKRDSVTVADNQRAIRICHKYGITTTSGFITGTPGETVQDLKRTYEFIKRNPIDNTYIYILTPYPGTEIWKIAKKMNLVSSDMDFGKLFVQLPPLSFFDFFKKSKPSFIKDRIFLNLKYKDNKEYLDLIFKIHKLTYIKNFIFYLKAIFINIGIIRRILDIKIRKFLFKGNK